MSSDDSERFSLNDIAALARHASMSSSYKPALLKALIRLVRRQPQTEISLAAIGAEFVELYWVQTVVFRLRQAATITAEPEVVRRIRTVAETTGVRKLPELPPEVRHRLNLEMARVLTINVLEAFHRSKPLGMSPLFDWMSGRSTITMTPGAITFLKTNAYPIETIANHWWARFLERVNMLAPLIIEKVERNGAQRSSLVKYLKILSQVDEPACFYCERQLSGLGTPHVDHVIPWSFLLSDPMWDLVLSCAHCNVSKSDTLPDRQYIEKLTDRGVRRAKLILPAGLVSPYIPREEIDRYFDAALSVEWPGGWSPTL